MENIDTTLFIDRQNTVANSYNYDTKIRNFNMLIFTRSKMHLFTMTIHRFLNFFSKVRLFYRSRYTEMQELHEIMLLISNIRRAKNIKQQGSINLD